jgi:hypothetical protein
MHDYKQLFSYVPCIPERAKNHPSDSSLFPWSWLRIRELMTEVKMIPATMIRESKVSR